MFNRLDGLYLHEKCLWIYTIIEDQYRKQIAEEIEKLNREKNPRNKRKADTSKVYFKNVKDPYWFTKVE